MLKSKYLYGTNDPRRTSLEVHDQLSIAYPAMLSGTVSTLSLQQGWLKEDTNAPQQVTSTNTKGSTSAPRMVSKSSIVDTHADAVPDHYELVPNQPEFSTEEPDTHMAEPDVLEEEDTSGHTIPLIEVNLI